MKAEPPSSSVLRGQMRAPSAPRKAPISSSSPNVSSDLAGKRVQLTIWARAANENPTKLFGIAYSRGGAGGTGWIALEPSKEIKPYSFAYKVPAAATQNSTGDYIGIWSDISGGGGGLEVRLITVRVLPPPPKNPS